MTVKTLPYKNLGGIVPCPGGWLVLPARLAGVTVVAEDAFVLPNLAEVLDYRPKFDAAAIDAPMGFNDHPVSPYRDCDAEARELIGWPRAVGVRPVPSREALRAPSREKALELEPWLTRDDFRRFRWLREVERELQPFHQRMFFSANPDLSFLVMNGDEPLKTSPFHEDGQLERLELIRQRLPGIDDVVTRVPPKGAGIVHMYRAAALLWTARRGSGRAISRLPLDPSWDPNGMRMELVR